MIRIIPAPGGWTWQMICGDGRVLAYCGEVWPTDLAAFEAGKRYRSAIWAAAAAIDHRMGACF